MHCKRHGQNSAGFTGRFGLTVRSCLACGPSLPACLVLAVCLAVVAAGLPRAGTSARDTALPDPSCTPAGRPLDGYWVCYAGSRRTMLRDGDLTAAFDLRALADTPHVYAIGPVEGLRGEITLYGGTPSIAVVADGAVRVDTTFDRRAVFLVYGAARHWRTVPVPNALDGLAAVEAFVRAAAVTAGLDPERPFPFRIEGRVNRLAYHVIFKTGDGPHDLPAHKRAKRPFVLKPGKDGNPVNIVGFWADAAGEGVYTHPGRRTHLHFQGRGALSSPVSGHVDDVSLGAGALLYLPCGRAGCD